MNLTVSGGALRHEFGIDDVGFGYLLSAFGWTYAIAQIPVGILLDRYGVKLVGRISTFCWSIFSLLDRARSAVVWDALRDSAGPRAGRDAGLSDQRQGHRLLVSDRRAGLATAIFDSAAKLATAIGVPFVSLILVNYGWRATFLVTGILSFLFFLAFYAFYRNPSESKRPDPRRARVHHRRRRPARGRADAPEA